MSIEEAADFLSREILEWEEEERLKEDTRKRCRFEVSDWSEDKTSIEIYIVVPIGALKEGALGIFRNRIAEIEEFL